jgi:hypothetical protein
MEILEVNPTTIWSFYPHAGLNIDFLNYLTKNPDKLQKVPVFQLPQEIAQDNDKFVLADGSHRRNIFIYLERKLPVIVYSPGEIINPTRDNLAPSRHLESPRLFDELIKRYQYVKKYGYPKL